jgi:ATP-dependent DNA helicase RecG
MRPESLFFLFSPVTRIKGVGGETAKALTRLLPPATALAGGSVPIIRDLLFHLPVGLLDRRFTCKLREAPDGVIATFVVKVEEHLPPKQRRYGKQPYKVFCSNDSGDITLVFFNASTDYLKQSLPVGQMRVISGRTEHFDQRLQMTHPDIIAPVSQLAEVQKPDAVYPLTVGLTSRRIGKIVNDALAKLPELPEWIAAEKQFPSWKQALMRAHHPTSQEDLLPTAPSRLRLAYDEMLSNQLHLALLRRNMQAQAVEIITGTGALTSQLLAALPFKLTKGQEQVYKEIYDDLQSGRRMGRLLQGDVGSGKTIVALLAMLRAVEQGLQTALMVPTELIASQHFEVITSLLSTLHPPSSTVLLTGSVKGKARSQALAAIASGEARIVIGTHALFQDKVEFKNLALAVIDEQHRFGVNQRMALTSKGASPHVLHMTATPIPRSLTMTLYGDMDCSLLKEKPAERKPIATRVIPSSRYEEVMQRLQAALDRGEKAYWICPLIEESPENTFLPHSTLYTPNSDLAAATSRHTEFKARFGDRVGLMHGRMPAEKRHEEMQKFASGATRLLVATTVVEVGVDVRDATIMVVEQAERFGLAQLHQLRGRVGRGDKPSACVLLYSEDSGVRIQESGSNFSSLHPESRIPNPSLARLSVLRETEDGFKIAEADLAQRGGGDLLGVRQSGLPRFIFTDLFEHQSLLEQSRQEVDGLLAADPALASVKGNALKLLLELFGYPVSPTGKQS